MAALTPPPPTALSFWSAVHARLSAWRRRRVLRAELNAVDRDDLRAILHDLNIEEAALPAMVDRSGRSRVLLPAMLERVGLDGASIENTMPAVANDLRRVCAGCTVKGRCGRALAAGHSTVRCMAFCPNAQTLDALRFGQRKVA